MYIIFSSVIGTIIDDKLKLLSKTIDNIKYSQSKGIKFAICTNDYHFENMNKLAFSIKADFLITSNGARIFDLKNQKIIFQNLISKNEIQEIWNQIKKLVHYITLSNEYKYQILLINKKYKNNVINKINKYNCNKNFFVFNNNITTNAYSIGCKGNKNNIDKIELMIKNTNLTTTRTSDSFLWIHKKHTSKVNSINYLIKFLGASINNIMTIGSGLNDLDIMKMTQHSYAMDNGIQALKKEANRYTSSVEQNGLGEAIIDFMFRNKIN